VTAQNYILATAGHVDHGKTALIKALTGTDTDRLPEEKARGITIDLGFAHLPLPGLSIGVIDVPGHEDFVRTMIAGIGAIDLALLVVAADDGWMPQTEEHLQILHYLGVRHGVVAITKCDLGDPARVDADVRRRLCGTSLGEISIVRTSSRTASGLDDLKNALAQVCAAIPLAPDIGKPRLFVDRVFTVRGTGTVVTGTLTGGQLARGDTVTLQPQNLPARIRAIQSHYQPLEIARPATRTALSLPDLRPEEIPRGSVLTTLSRAEASRTIDVLLERSERAVFPSRSLKSNSVVQFHYGSARFAARIILLDGRELLPGARALARLRFAEPVFVFVGDRFVIRDSSGRQTVAGGLVLNAGAERTRFRSQVERAFLQERAKAPNDLLVLLRTQLARDRVWRRASLLVQSNFSAEEIATAISRLARAGEVFVSGAIVAPSAFWQELRDRALAAIDAEHHAHPDRAGLSLARLRDLFAKELPETFEVLVRDLCDHGAARAGDIVRRATHRPTLPPSLQAPGEAIRSALKDKPFDPPSRRELAADALSQQALRYFLATGEAVEINPAIVLSRDGFEKMRAAVIDFIRRAGPATAGELRQALKSSRRIMVPFLERLDRDGVTRRQGDKRFLAR
jgi:selenocysteine-specific elongation factor